MYRGKVYKKEKFDKEGNLTRRKTSKENNNNKKKLLRKENPRGLEEVSRLKEEILHLFLGETSALLAQGPARFG